MYHCNILIYPDEMMKYYGKGNETLSQLVLVRSTQTAKLLVNNHGMICNNRRLLCTVCRDPCGERLMVTERLVFECIIVKVKVMYQVILYKYNTHCKLDCECCMSIHLKEKSHEQCFKTCLTYVCSQLVIFFLRAYYKTT